MLTVYNNGVGYPISNDDYYIRELASGYDEIVFNVFIRDPVYQYIVEEATIRDRDQNYYLIKQIDAGETTAKVVAQINLDDWKKSLFVKFSNESATVLQTVQMVLPTGWSVIDYSLVTKRRTIPTSETTKDYNVTALEVLEACVETYEVRFRFNTRDKIIGIINPANYQPQGAFATRDLNLKKLNYKGKSDNFITRLYASGADGLTFESINDGKDYVENYSYSNKTICAYWSDERYTDKESLLEDATAKLAEMARPSRSYQCEVLDLANTNPDMYGFEDFSLFNVITLVDDAKSVRTNYQVVERWTYPYYPVKNKITLSTSTPNIQSAIVEIVNAINNSTSGFQQILQSAINNATSLITGNSGGYLVLHDSDDDGTPDELLIMDRPSIETATKVWRWNQAGLGYSDTGYDGQYTVGITMDGAIVADFITAGSFNGGLIRANTVEASALTAAARESLKSKHEYLPSDAMSNRTLWETSSDYYASLVYFETVGDKTYLVLDGTGLSEFNSNAYARIATDAVGDVDFNVIFKYHVDTAVTVETQRFPAVWYYNQSSESVYVTWKNLPAQSIPADTDFDWDITFNIAGIDSTKRPTKFGLYFIPGTKIYLEEISIISSLEGYAEAGMEFTANGLSLVAQEVEQAGAHSYLPYDAITNVSRWSIVKGLESDNPVVTHETITVGGKSYDAIVLDGTNVTSGYQSTTYAYVEADPLGQPLITAAYNYQVDGDITIPSASYKNIGKFYGTDVNGNSVSMFVNDIYGPATLTAGTDYSYSYDQTPGSRLSNNLSEKGQLRFGFIAGVKKYIYNLSFQSSGTSYKKASLSFTPDGLDSVVQAGNIISTINQSAEAVEISASKINLAGALSLNGDFHCYDSGYDHTDPTTYTYAFLDDGNLSFYYQNANVFTVASTPLLGNKAGIFFGDAEDPTSIARYTHINQDVVQTPQVYIKNDGRYDTYQWPLVVEGTSNDTSIYADYVSFEYMWIRGLGGRKTEIYGDVEFSNFSGGAAASVRFYSTVLNSSGSTVFVSDKRKKRSIKDLAIDKARSFIMALKPRKFKFTKDISKSDRFHHGFIAQEVKEAMHEDWGLYVEDPKQDFIGLRYDEILADLVKVVQDQQSRIEELERRLDDHTNIQP